MLRPSDICQGNGELAVLRLDQPSTYGQFPISWWKLLWTDTTYPERPKTSSWTTMGTSGWGWHPVGTGSRKESLAVQSQLSCLPLPLVCWWRPPVQVWNSRAPPPSEPLWMAWQLPLHQCLDPSGPGKALLLRYDELLCLRTTKTKGATGYGGH